MPPLDLSDVEHESNRNAGVYLCRCDTPNPDPAMPDQCRRCWRFIHPHQKDRTP